MPPRFAYWTIILDGTPTSFRARERDEIVPLFNQLKKKNPGALLKWFSGGKLWDSPEQAREERQLEHERQFQEQKNLRSRGASAPRSDRAPWKGGDRPMGPKPDRDRAPWQEPKNREAFRDRGAEAPRLRKEDDRLRKEDDRLRKEDDRLRKEDDRLRKEDDRPPAERPVGPKPDRDRAPWKGAERPRQERRGKDWRPGGEHKDPRDKYKLPPGEARKRWKQRHLGPKPFGDKPAGPPSTSLRPGKPFGGKPAGPPRSPGFKPAGPRPFTRRPPGGPGRNRPK